MHMRKEQRKARLKALKLARKAAKRALREASGQVAREAAARAATEQAAEPALTPSTSSGQASPAPTPREQAPQPEAAAPVRNREAAAAEELKPAAAQTLEPPSPGSEAWALAKLIGAAEFLSRFVAQAEDALGTIERSKVEAILKQHQPEPGQTEPQKRPRGAPHPIFVLFKLGVAAAKQLTQVIKATNPALFTMSPDKADLLGLARASGDYIRKLERARGRTMASAA